ncbi:hypothetical protein CC2G_004806 [Coprinopsis cinerea AmutBmut pab1-1]|nr:hypothetical protein CC2G_004806 [Coprinopsis cinerea AmutBmut pab1-1]
MQSLALAQQPPAAVIFTLDAAAVPSVATLWASVLFGISTVFSRLNFAPETIHHFLRISKRLSMSSSSDRKIVVLSAKRFASTPRDSMARLKRRHDKGSPCRTPRMIW